VLFGPVHHRVQRTADRRLFGYRRDPYRAIQKLGERLNVSAAGSDIAESLAEIVSDALRLPHVAVRRSDGTEANTGTPVAEPVVVPLAYRGERVGELLASPRQAGTSLTAAERRVLEELAQLVSVALHADSLANEVQQARGRLVRAVEDERRRLRRDLHDGLGPFLASLSMGLERVSLRLRDIDGTSDVRVLVWELGQRLSDAIDDVRRLVHDLRPPTLDDLGLIGALQSHPVGASGPGTMVVEVHGPDVLPPLPAAVELAAYRIAMEAMTNAARHSGARRCRVDVAVNAALELSVSDDGIGPGPWRAGVGLVSMRERTAELGGTLSFRRGSDGGTVVCVRLPLEDG
jgi:two-component system, NarL family, sensor kinase